MKLTKIKKKLTASTKSMLTKLKKKRSAVKKKVAKKKTIKKRATKIRQNKVKVQKNNMSGIPNFKKNLLIDYGKIIQKQKELEFGIVSNQRILKVPGQPKHQKDNARKLIKLYKLLLSENKTHAAQLKKLL